MHSPRVCIYWSRPVCQHYFITARHYIICSLIHLWKRVILYVLCFSCLSGGNRRSWQATVKLACKPEPALLISHISDIQKHPQIAVWQILFSICFLKSLSWVLKKCIHRQKNNTLEENIVSNRCTQSPRGRRCDVHRYSIRLFVWTLQRPSHVPAHLVLGGAGGLPEGREEAAASRWIVFSWAVQQAGPHFLISAVSNGIECTTLGSLEIIRWQGEVQGGP